MANSKCSIVINDAELMFNVEAGLNVEQKAGFIFNGKSLRCVCHNQKTIMLRMLFWYDKTSRFGT